LLASKGAHVTIVARDKDHLQIALEEIKDVSTWKLDSSMKFDLKKINFDKKCISII